MRKPLILILAALACAAWLFVMLDKRAPRADQARALTAGAAGGGEEVFSPVRDWPPAPPKWEEAAAPVLRDFSSWSRRYLEADDAGRAALVAEGVALARARRAEFKSLIVEDPRAAVEGAVPMVVRQALPPEVVAELERRVHATADVEVLAVSEGSGPDEPVVRWFTRFGGEELRTYVYGRRSGHNSLYGVPVHGVAVDEVLALAESPARVLEIGERPPAGAKTVETCPVSGLSTAVENTQAPIVEETPAVQAGENIVYLCDGGHIRMFVEELVAGEGGTGGAAGLSAPAASGWNNGPRKLLYMRVIFEDSLQEPQTEAQAWGAIEQLNDYFAEVSFGKVFYLADVTPAILLPRSRAWYTADYTATGSNSPIMTDAKEAARALGYNPDNYQHFTVIYTGGTGNGPGTFGGLGSVGGANVWLRTTSIGTFAHEIGHNVGLWHGNSWDSNRTIGVSWNTSLTRDVIGGGLNGEYGHSYDVLGSSGSFTGNKGHFMAHHKNLMNWLPTETVAAATTSGVYRIFPMDQTVLDPERRYALRVTKDAGRDYWVDFRQKYNADHRWFRDGVLLHWSRWGQNQVGNEDQVVGGNRGGQLLDTTPGSADGKNDAPVVIGRTFSDRESGVHITPLGKGGTTPESMDVQVHLGFFPGNNAPVIHSLTASTTTPALNGTVNFSVDATDPDGDPLAYFWDFGDATYGVNAAATSKQFTTARHYAVRCIVSDMKGGETSKLVLITAGAPSTRTASGRVLDGLGNPVAEVRIQNGSTGTSFRGAWTDSNGDFVVTNLTSSSVLLTPVKGGHVFSPVNINVPSGGSVTGMDYTANDAVLVSIEAVDAEAAETGGNTGLFRITRTGSTAADLTVITDLQGDATFNTDHTLAPAPNTTALTPLETFTLPAGASTLDITLTANNDSTREGPEAARIVLMPSNSYSITGAAAATVVIQDTGTNSVPNRVSVAAVDEDAHETGEAGVFEIRRTGPVDASLNVSITLDGAPNTAAAANGQDYQTISSPVTIPAGESAVQVTVVPLQDTLIEGQETVRLTVASNSAYGVGTPNSAIVRIADDDIPTVTLTATDAAASEAGNNTGTFTVTRTGDTGAPLTLGYTAGGSALHGTDYLPLPGEVTIPAGQSSADILIVPIDDDHGEPNQTVVLQLRADPRHVPGTPHRDTVTISDNDLPVVAVGVLDATCNEPSDAGSFRITTTGSGTGNITVRYTVSGTATPGADYTALTGTLSMAKNATATLTVTPINDSLQEDAESVVVTLLPDPAYQVDVLQPEAMLVIRDDDSGSVVNASFSTLTMTESGNSKLFLSRTSSTGAATTSDNLTVSYALSGTATPGVDYSGLSGMAVIPSGASNVSVDITGIDDSDAEGTESLIVTILPGSYSRERATATLHITDNESAGFARTASFATRRTVKTEGDAPFTIPVVLSSPDPVNEVRVDYILDTNSATGSGVDVNLKAGSLVFPPGVSQVEIPVSIVDDLLPEPEEHVTLKLSFAHGAQLTSGGSYHTLFIRDNEPRVSLRAAHPAAYESNGAPGAFTLSRTGPVNAPLEVSLAWSGTATAGADYAAMPATASFAAGERHLELPVTPLPDALAEGTETVIATLNASSRYLVVGEASTTVDILDNATNHPPTVRITQPRRAEAGLSLSTGLHLGAAVTDDGAPGSTSVLWTHVSGPGTATFGQASALETTVVFSAAGRHILRCTATDAGSLSAHAEVAVAVGGGGALWAAEDIGITGTNATGSADIRSGWAQNQGAGSSITASSDSFHFQHTELSGDGEIVARYEGTDGLFSNARTGVMLRDGTAANARCAGLTVLVTVSGGNITSTLAWTRRTTAGGAVSTTTASLPHGPRWLKLARAGSNFSAWHSLDGIDWTQVGTAQAIALPATLRAGIATTSGNTARPARGLFSGIQVSGTPENAAPLSQAATTPSISAAAFRVLAGSVLDDAPDAPDAQWSVVSGPGVVTFEDAAAAQTTAQFAAEGAYVLRLSADDGEASSFDDVAVDVQFATLGFGAAADAAEEGAAPGLVTVTRNGQLDMPLTVHYTTGGSASAPGDYQALPGSVTIPAGESSAAIQVQPVADDVAEGDKTLAINLQADATYHLPVEPVSVIQVKDRPMDAWRFAQFGAQANNPAVNGLLMDPDNDGWNNLLEYALGLQGMEPDESPLAQDTATVGQDKFLRLTVPKNPDATGITYTVEATSDVTDPLSWSSAGLVVEVDNATTLRVRDNVPAGPGVIRFLRARVTMP